MAEAISFWVHLVAAAVWIGPQFFLPLAAIPAMRILEPGTRKRALQVMTARFNYLSWLALLVLIVTGIGNVFQVRNDAFGEDFGAMFDVRYGMILTIKLILVATTLALTAWHSFVLGPRMLQNLDAAEGSGEGPGTAGYRRLQRTSVIVSSLNLAIGVAILYLVTLLQNGEFSMAA
jgi:putative copper export protein